MTQIVKVVSAQSNRVQVVQKDSNSKEVIVNPSEDADSLFHWEVPLPSVHSD